MSSKHRKDSFLRDATTISDGLFLGLNNLPNVPRSVEDQVYEIGHSYDERPDLLAHQVYGNSRLWWVFSLRNPDVLKDPIRDFKPGTTIVVPAVSSVASFL